MPRIPAYTEGMDAKTRYRRRLKLQAALRRLIEVYVSNSVAEIPPDRTTALMAAQVMGNLIGFCEDAGVASQSARPDSARFEKRIKDKQRETAARRR
jgi:hypothetical protein